MRTKLLLTIACLAWASGLASAEPGEHFPQRATRYYLSGQDDIRGKFEGWLIVKPIFGSTDYEVVRRVQLRKGKWELHRGFGTPQGDRLEVLLRTDRALVDTLREHDWAPARQTAIRFSASGIVTRGASAAGTTSGRGHVLSTVADSALAPVDPPDPELEGKLKQKARGLGKHLLVLARRELDGLATDGVGLSERFNLSRYLHVGVGLRIHQLDPKLTTSEQRRVLARKPDHVWIVTEADGGVTVPLSVSIPVGGVSVGVGFSVGARVRYEVTDVYALPDGWDTDRLLSQLRELSTQSYDLPLDAHEARDMDVGARRVMDGTASVAVSGHLALGHEVAKLGEVVRIGVSARAGGFYRFQGRLRFEVQRLLGSSVRLRVTRGYRHQPGVNANVLLGAAVNKQELESVLEPALDYFDEALIDPASKLAKDVVVSEGSSQIKKLLRFRIDLGGSKVFDDELALSFRFDLANPAAADAYQRAVRGDLRPADALALTPDESGVVREFRVVDVEERTHLSADIDLSLLLEAGASRSVSLSDLHVSDETGVTHYEIFRAQRQRRFSIFGLNKRRRSVLFELVRRTRETDPAPISRSLHYVLSARKPNTWKRDGAQIERLMTAWGLQGESHLPLPDFVLFRTRYRNTKTSIDVGVAEAGIDSVFARSRERLFQAYAGAHEVLDGQVPLWATAEGRDTLERTRYDDRRDPTHAKADKALARAERFVSSLHGLGRAEDPELRAKLLKDLTRNAGYRLYVIAAIVELAPRETVSLSVVLDGRRIRLRDGHLGQQFAFTAVEDPRSR